MFDYKLNDFYDKYKKSKDLERLAFGTLYKMYGGKRDVDSYSMEMVWYLSSVIYIDLAQKQLREKELKHEKELSKLWIEKEKKELEQKFKEEVMDDFSRYFITCLFNLKHYYDIDYRKEKVNNTFDNYEIFNSNYQLFVKGSVCLHYNYAIAEILKNIRKIYIELYYNQRKQSYDTYTFMVDDYKLGNLDMNLWHYIYNTKLQIKERNYPENKLLIV